MPSGHKMHAGMHMRRAPMLQSSLLRKRRFAQLSHQLKKSPLSLASPQRGLTLLCPLLAAAPDSIDSVESDSEMYDEFEGVRQRDRGFTPFEFIEFTDIPLKHEVSVWVDRPIGDCYQVWDNRLNWMQWFDMIDEVGFHEEEPSYISMYLWYRWATTPFLELYVTLERTQAELNKYILEEPVEGMPLVAAVLFQEGDEEVATASGTTITLRLSYLLPKVLYEFAGQVAVYGDVDKKLCACMERMKEFIEAIDIEEVERIRLENEAEIRANFAAQRERKSAALKRREERIAKWAAEAEAASGDSSSGTLGLEESDREEDQQLKSDGDGAEEESDSKEITRLTMPSDGTAMSNPAARKRRRKISGKAPEDPVE